MNNDKVLMFMNIKTEIMERRKFFKSVGLVTAAAYVGPKVLAMIRL